MGTKIKVTKFRMSQWRLKPETLKYMNLQTEMEKRNPINKRRQDKLSIWHIILENSYWKAPQLFTWL